MNDLLKQLTEKFDLPLDKATGILETVAGFLGDKLPGPIGDQVSKLLGGDDGDDGDDGGLLDSAKDALGGLLGGGND